MLLTWLFIFSTNILKERINFRKRNEEIGHLSNEYLEKLNDIYNSVIDSCNVLKIQIPIDNITKDEQKNNFF